MADVAHFVEHLFLKPFLQRTFLKVPQIVNSQTRIGRFQAECFAQKRRPASQCKQTNTILRRTTGGT
jgi:hypothetical protein